MKYDIISRQALECENESLRAQVKSLKLQNQELTNDICRWIRAYMTEIRQKVLERARNKCEFCGLENHSIADRNGKPVKIVLTIAHLDNIPEHCEMSNLRALCQKCHLTYDAKLHAANAAETRRRRRLGFSD